MMRIVRYNYNEVFLRHFLLCFWAYMFLTILPSLFQGSLVCYLRFAAGEPVPGCSGDGISREDYCCNRPPNYLLYVGNGLGPNGLGLCEGDCDDDTDCAESLICEQRRGFTEVPGCEGMGRKGSDYCRDPDPSTLGQTRNHAAQVSCIIIIM